MSAVSTPSSSGVTGSQTLTCPVLQEQLHDINVVVSSCVVHGGEPFSIRGVYRVLPSLSYFIQFSFEVNTCDVTFDNLDISFTCCLKDDVI